MILVDYRCPHCAGAFEVRVPSPPPSSHACPACRGAAARVWSPIGLSGKTGGEAGTVSDAPSGPAGADPLCVRNPTVPGICHMDPDSARTWVARATRDNRSLERELARQEQSVRDGTVPAAATGGHHHGPGHGHGHTHAATPAAAV